MTSYLQLAFTVVLTVANLVFLYAQRQGKSDQASADRDKRDLDTARWMDIIRDRTHKLANQMDSLPTELSKFFVPRETWLLTKEQHEKERASLHEEIEKLWAEFRKRSQSR